jgi:hypothetical protein
VELDERRAAHRDEAEEHHHEHVAQAVVAERPRPTGVRHAREDRGDADRDHRPAGRRDEVEAEQRGNAERRDHRALHRRGADQPGADRAHRADAIGAVGAALGVEHIVGEVGADLDRERSGERRQGGAPRDAAARRGDRGADDDRHDRRGQRAQPGGADPGRRGRGHEDLARAVRPAQARTPAGGEGVARIAITGSA